MFDPADIDAQLSRVTKAFTKAYGRAATHAATAPGRVNLIGEHIDYCDGFVLPIAIERQSVVVAAPRTDSTARLRSTQLEGEAVFEVDDQPVPLGAPEWSRYLRGVVASAYTPVGFDLMLDSTVPAGGGLSSSASIEVATACLFEAMFAYTEDATTRALRCQMAEHRYGGTPCGIMDQFASSLCQSGHALLLDCQDRSVQQVAMDDQEVVVLVANSNAPHELSGGEYAQRRHECAEALATIGAVSWRDVDADDVAALEGKVRDVVWRRARHVVGEIERTVSAARALQREEWGTVGAAMWASHASLRDLFEVSTPELDALVQLADQASDEGGVIGARMTGGGFGGCTVTLCERHHAEAVTKHLMSGYAKRTGKQATVFATRAAGGARVLEV